MSAGVLLDATPLASAHALRGIGAAVQGLLSGFRQLGANERPRLLVRHTQDVPTDFEARAMRWPRWRGYRIPDPWPRAVGERALRRRDEAIFHATQPSLIPRGPGVVVTLYDLIPAIYPEHYLQGVGRLPERRAYHRFLERASSADAVIAISQETAADATRLLDVPYERITVIPLGRSQPVAASGPIPSRPYVLYSGGLEHHKNVPLLIDALSATPSNVSLVATGAWSDRRLARLQRRARQSGVANKIEWRGHVVPGELEALRRGAVAQVVPSLKEGFGLPVLEAMSSGAAVLCSDTPALREVAGDAGRYLPADNAEAWAEAIDEYASSPDLVAGMREPGLTRSRRFSWRASAAATLNVYASLGGGAAG